MFDFSIRTLCKSASAMIGSGAPPAKAAEKGIALTELLDRVKGVIDEGFPKAEWVRAEISELRDKNGHLYLTLTERNERSLPK